MRSLLLPSFTGHLLNSRAYKRARYFRRRRGSSSHSVISFNTSSMKGDTWSMLSDMSLGELSISEISVLELPICLADLHDLTPFQQTALHSTVRACSGTRTVRKWAGLAANGLACPGTLAYLGTLWSAWVGRLTCPSTQLLNNEFLKRTTKLYHYCLTSLNPTYMNGAQYRIISH